MGLVLSRRSGEEIRIFCGDDVSDEEVLAAVRGEGLLVRVDGVYTPFSREPLKGVTVRLSICASRCIDVWRSELLGRLKSP